MLAKQARRLLNLVDDTPIVPGDTHPTFDQYEAARQVLNDAEEQLRDWRPNNESINSNAGGLGAGAMPSASGASAASVTGGGGNIAFAGQEYSATQAYTTEQEGQQQTIEGAHPAYRKDSPERSVRDESSVA